MSRTVLHHAALPHRGGAVRVARLLAQAQREAGLDARLSYEVQENDPEALPPATSERIRLCGPTPPGGLGQAWAELPDDACLHLHTSTDWPALLAGLPHHAANRQILLTLHDATPLTGGCAYPLDCPHFPACADPCPRQFPDARARQNAIAELLGSLAQARRPAAREPLALAGWTGPAGLARSSGAHHPQRRALAGAGGCSVPRQGETGPRP